MNSIPQLWLKLRRKYWLSLAFDVAAILVVFVLIHSWQSRHLLPGGQEALAPDFLLTSLDREVFQLSDYRDRKTILYFFSPSCGICNVSMPNLQKLHEARGGENFQVFGVALSYSNRREVAEFSDQHKFSFPILLGTWNEATNYRIRGFPTYYIIDDQGRVEQRSVGYSTLLGLHWRSS